MTIDISALLDAPVGKQATEFEVTPANEYPNATIDTSDVKDWFQTGTNKEGGTWVKLNVPFIIHDEALRTSLGRARLTSRLTCWLDMDASGQISTDKGKNVTLGQLRDALGQNDIPNWTPRMLPGAGPVKIMTKVRDGDDGRKYSEVTRVAKAS